MIRNLKALGLALCAVFMFGALSVPASAEITDNFTSPVNDTWVTGTQIGGVGGTNVFATQWEPNATFSCATGTYSGTFSGTSATSVSFTPAYTGCKLVGFNATFDDGLAGCEYVLTGDTDTYLDTNNLDQGKDATFTLACADTGTLKITGVFGCTITLMDTHPEGTAVNQNRLGVVYHNEFDGTKWDVKVTFTIDKITYTSTPPCQALGITATDSDGFLKTNVTLKAYSNAAHTNRVDLTMP